MGGRLTGSLAAFQICLVVFLTLTRRPPKATESSWWPHAAALISVLAPLAFQPIGRTVIPGSVTTSMMFVSLATWLAGLLMLDQSFGILPANRGVIQCGIYGWVRHPLYASYLCAHAAVLLTYLSVWNVAVWCIADGMLLLRLYGEERLLQRDPVYVNYMRRVQWRLLPGVF